MFDLDFDFLDFVGFIDGYMFGDLVVLVFRVRNEVIIWLIGGVVLEEDDSLILFSKVDFD